MNVCRVARQKTSTYGKFVDMPRVHLIGREPVDVRNIEVEFRVFFYPFLYLLIKHIALVLIKLLGERADDAKTVFTDHREKRQKRILHQKNLQRFMPEFPVE